MQDITARDMATCEAIPHDVTPRDIATLDTMLTAALVHADSLGLDLVAIHLEQARALLSSDIGAITD